MERISDVRFSSDETVAAALDRYLDENGFTHAEYDAAWTHASFLGVPLAVPNTRLHQQGIRLHDLHHLATGFGTDIVGEGEISAWELGSGLRGVGVYVGSIVCMGAVIGFVASPRRAIRAYRLARRARGASLWSPLSSDTPGFSRYDALMRLTVGELRALLAIPDEGLLEGDRRLHGRAPACATMPMSPC